MTEHIESWRSLLDRSPRIGRQQRVLVLTTKLVHAMPHHSPQGQSGAEGKHEQSLWETILPNGQPHPAAQVNISFRVL